MVNKYDQKHKERLRKKAHERYQIVLKAKKRNGEKRFGTTIKIFLKNKCRNYLSIWKVII